MLSVVYEDDWIVAVNKEAGIHSCPLEPGETGTASDCVLAAYPEIRELRGVKAVEPGLVHRLDRDTSGLLLFARSDEAFEALRNMQERDLVVKEYLACCFSSDGELPGARPARHCFDPKSLPAAIESRFRPFGTGSRRVAPVAPGAEGINSKARKAAAERLYRTDIIEMEALSSRLFRTKARITRGFRHQIRAHLAWVGFPILHDDVYGGIVNRAFDPEMDGNQDLSVMNICSEKRQGLRLHAYSLGFRHPFLERDLRIECPPEPGFFQP